MDKNHTQEDELLIKATYAKLRLLKQRKKQFAFSCVLAALGAVACIGGIVLAVLGNRSISFALIAVGAIVVVVAVIGHVTTTRKFDEVYDKLDQSIRSYTDSKQDESGENK